MNERIKKLALQAQNNGDSIHYYDPVFAEKFAELIVRECCLALWTEECHTSDLAFDEVKRNATRIKEHFRIDPNEITEAMLDRSIKWMEQQLGDKKHFGVEERKGWVCPKCGVDRTREACPKGHTAAIIGDCPMTATAQSGVEE